MARASIVVSMTGARFTLAQTLPQINIENENGQLLVTLLTQEDEDVIVWAELRAAIDTLIQEHKDRQQNK